MGIAGGPVAHRDQGLTRRIRSRNPAFRPDGDLGLSNQPFPEGSPGGWLKARWSGTRGARDWGPASELVLTVAGSGVAAAGETSLDVRVQTHGGGGVAGLCAPTPSSIPIMPRQTLDSPASRANPLGPRCKAEKREKELGKGATQ